MTPTNEQELREWLAEYATSSQGDSYYIVTPDAVSNYEIEELQALITAHTNAGIAKVLDRLEKTLKYGNKTIHKRTLEAYIQAERAKLKEVK